MGEFSYCCSSAQKHPREMVITPKASISRLIPCGSSGPARLAADSTGSIPATEHALAGKGNTGGGSTGGVPATEHALAGKGDTGGGKGHNTGGGSTGGVPATEHALAGKSDTGGGEGDNIGGGSTGGFRATEYAARFGNSFDKGKLRTVCLAHLRGLAWCAHYYYHGEELIEFHFSLAIWLSMNRLIRLNESMN